MDKQFHPTLYQAYYYLSMLRLKLIYICKRGPWWINFNPAAFDQSYGHLIFVMVIPLPGRTVFILKHVPGLTPISILSYILEME